LSSPPPVVVIQDGREQWRYTGLTAVIETRRAADVAGALAEVERAVGERGLYAAGYQAYEAAAAYGLATRDPADEGPPLLWFGLFTGREPVALAEEGAYAFGAWEPSVTEAAYVAAVDAVKQAIAAGNTYQANLTFQLRAAFQGDPWALYGALCRAQRARYTAYLDLGRHVICSASPELFYRREGDTVTARPMKGTAARGLTTTADRAQAEWLHKSEKNRAENVMIVDMIRNDLGRVATTGSVRVPELFAIERYPTLLQMTSTVTAETGVGLAKLMAAAFPCASITGAPKVRTMRLLQALEPEPRGVYTGAIGFLSPDGRSQFNVAIRTVVIDRRTETAAYGVGSGIVWDSEPAAEYAECLLKARVLDVPAARADFSLLESLRWTLEDGYWLLDRHISRLLDSAEYFNIPADEPTIREALQAAGRDLAAPAKARLLVGQDGRPTVETVPLAVGEGPSPLRLGVALEPVWSGDRWLYHKTTERGVYERAHAGRPDCDDVVLVNERGEVTETSRANLVVEMDGRRYTPPVSCGLLAGTARQELLERGEIAARILSVDDLRQAQRMWTLNSVRGLQAAELV
jgi:para-aminobenzoate synthetase/4-amino-4-deoxychorismate lyase